VKTPHTGNSIWRPVAGSPRQLPKCRRQPLRPRAAAGYQYASLVSRTAIEHRTHFLAAHVMTAPGLIIVTCCFPERPHNAIEIMRILQPDVLIDDSQSSGNGAVRSRGDHRLSPRNPA